MSALIIVIMGFSAGMATMIIVELYRYVFKIMNQ